MSLAEPAPGSWWSGRAGAASAPSRDGALGLGDGATTDVSWNFRSALMTLRWVPRHRAAPVSPRDALASAPGRAFGAQTLRQIVHLQQGGDALRLHLCNKFGQEALEVG